ncbi:MAG: hypothetical protein NVSMB56_11730 [Pyrinomonadaceae bacterium]
MFGFGHNSDEYFFGLQLVIRAFGEDTLRVRLAEVIAAPESGLESVEAKRRYMKRIVGVLVEQEPYWSQVFWDYKTGDEAASEFDSWAAELSATTATETEELADKVDNAYRVSNEKDYVALTIILLLSEPFPPAEIEDETQWWTSVNIGKLVRGLLRVNPETILADGVFVVPGNANDGLSDEDLLTGGWSYLRVIN